MHTTITMHRFDLCDFFHSIISSIHPLIFTEGCKKSEIYARCLTPLMMLMLLMMMIVDLYSALRRAPLLRYVSRCIVKRNVYRASV